MNSIIQQLKTGTLSQFHLIYGEESYMVRYYKNKIIQSMGLEKDEMNFSKFEDAEIDITSLLDAAQTLPFFAEQRLILVSDSGFFKKANDLVDFMDDIPESTIVLFIEKAIDKRSRLYKYIAKNGLVTEVNHKSENELINWVAAYLKSAKKNISKATVVRILHRVGTSMELLSLELEKLISYTWDREIVEDSDVDIVCTGQIANKIFDMIDAVSVDNQRKALSLYHDLLALKEPPNRILYLFVRHVNQLIQVKEEGRQAIESDVARKIGVPPFAVRKLISQASRFSDKKLFEMLSKLIELEEAVKSGRMIDQLSVELFILEDK
jgi:DNA polymerase-3 subunit delta